MNRLLSLFFIGSLMLSAIKAGAEEVLTVAVFNFESAEEGGRDLGAKAATLVTANLSAEPQIITVERAELEKILGEQELSLSGTVSTDTAAKVGHLTGAKVLVTGRIFRADKEMVMVAKIISTETSRVYGEIVKGPASTALTDMTADLAKKIGATVVQKGETLVAKVKTTQDRIEAVKKNLKKDKLPTVSVKIEERHVGAPIIDPAAETEVSLMLKESGFNLLDNKAGGNPDIEFTGEAFSTFGMRKGNLYSCQARVELKAIDKATGKVLAVDRQTSVAVNLSEQIAAKTALQQAAAELAERLIPKAVK